VSEPSPQPPLSLSFHSSLNANDEAAKNTARIITERPAQPFGAQSWMSLEGPPLVAISPLGRFPRDAGGSDEGEGRV